MLCADKQPERKLCGSKHGACTVPGSCCLKGVCVHDMQLCRQSNGNKWNASPKTVCPECHQRHDPCTDITSPMPCGRMTNTKCPMYTHKQSYVCISSGREMQGYCKKMSEVKPSERNIIMWDGEWRSF